MSIESREISVESINLHQLFEKQLAVPEYQRPYVWKEKNIKALLKQIAIHNEAEQAFKPMFYLGSIVLHKDQDDNLNIIDGQQRITTLAILASILNKKEYAIKYASLVSQQNIYANYSMLQKQKEDLKPLNFEEINVTVIITESQDDAYNFFETLNTGGKRLTGIDILKAHHLRSVNPLDIDSYARIWEKDQSHLTNSIKLLLKARSWNHLKFIDVPRRRSGLPEWKEIITKEFTQKTKNIKDDIAYNHVKKNRNSFEHLGNEYALRQPLGNGKNFINYFISYVKLYKGLFLETGAHSEYYQKFNTKIVEHWNDGTVDLRALYQLALLAYASRFGTDRIEDAALWLFRHVYSLRLSKENRVMEATVINHNKDRNLIDTILSLYEEEELLSWLKSFKYTINKENMAGIKGRHIHTVKEYFGLKLEEDFTNFDDELKKKINKKLKVH